MPERSNFFHQSDLLDDLFEFHREWFDDLASSEIKTLDLYFGLLSRPSNVESWRDDNCANDPTLERRALAVLRDFLAEFGMNGENTHYLKP